MGFFSRDSLERYIYLTLLFFLPTQLGKHFWPDFAYVGGLRIDYLSPTLFFTDVLLFLLFLLFLRNKPQFPVMTFSKNQCIVLLFFLFLILGIVFSKNPLAGIVGLGKLLEIGFFGYYTAMSLGSKVPMVQAVYVLSLSVLFEALLAMVQFFIKGSVGGVLYLFGERSFSMLTPGIANASIQGSLLLRPYGTLPHPNVLAGFLLLSMVFLVGCYHYYKGRFSYIVVGLALLFGTIGLLLTLSRIAILWFVILLGLLTFFLLKEKMSKKLLFSVVTGCILVGSSMFFIPLLGRFTSSSFLEEAFLVRQDLALHALEMIKTHPFFGVGLQNFLTYLPSSLSAWSYFTQIQPVHNMYLLMLAEVGIPAALVCFYALFKTIRHVQNAPSSLFRMGVLLMLLTVFILGFFDHYFLTLQQGRLLFAFVLGVCWQLSSPKAPRKISSKRTKKNTL